MTTSNISISENRAVIELPSGKTVQFVIWDLDNPQHEDLKTQIAAAFSICSNFEEIETHLKNNGYDARLEDIYENKI